MNFIKNLYNKFRLWLEFNYLEVSSNKTQDSFILGIQTDLQKNTLEITQDDQAQKLNEAVNVMKTSILTEASIFKSVEEYLAQNPDLLLHAKENNHIKDIIRSTWDLRNQDNSSPEDLMNIINRRIEHFYELQRYNEKRILIKQIKLAQKQGDMLTYNSLMKEWKQKYEIQRH